MTLFNFNYQDNTMHELNILVCLTQTNLNKVLAPERTFLPKVLQELPSKHD